MAVGKMGGIKLHLREIHRDYLYSYAEALNTARQSY
jgi:hypothetical protein